jgi:hypothetical protein
MKRLAMVLVMVLLPVPIVAQVANLKLIQNGEFASLSEAPTGSSFFSLSVSRNTTNNATTANINYQSFSFSSDFSSFTFVQIIGPFAAADFTGQNIQSLTLTFSTADLDPSAINLSCTLDLNTFTETCSPAPAGTISVTWRQNGASSTQVVLGQTQTVGNLTTRLHQRSDNSTATATGTVFGTTVVGGNATVGINHSSTLEATRTQ